MPRTPAVYILASAPHGTLYIGVTSDLVKRVWQHRTDAAEGFTKQYAVHTLVYYELHAEMMDAIRREKQLKRWNRAWKVELIEHDNPRWDDLWPTLWGARPEPVARTGGPPHPGGDRAKTARQTFTVTPAHAGVQDLVATHFVARTGGPARPRG